MRKIILLMATAILPLAASEADAAAAIQATAAEWRAQVRALAGSYVATVRTAEVGSGFRVEQQFAVVVYPTDQQLGLVGVQLPNGPRTCTIVTGEPGSAGFHDQSQLPFLNGKIERTSDPASPRLVLAVTDSIDGSKVVIANLALLQTPGAE